MSNRYSRTFHQQTNPFSIRWILASSAIATLAAILPSPALAQSAPAQSNQPTLPTTVCSYNPDGAPNPLGMRAFVTVSEVGGNSVFVYEQFPSPLSGSTLENGPATIARERTLTLFDTPIAEARQLVVDDPAYYAALTGATVEQIGDNGFSEVNDTLTCQDITAANPPVTPTPGTPTPGTPAPTPATPTTTFADLPNGNYRVVAADLPLRVFDTTELLELDTLLYRFNKTGNTVVGYFLKPETDISVCIAGTIEGNVVTGTASSAGTEATVPDSAALTIDDSATGEALEATLNLEGFSRINAGTIEPPESCD